MKSFTWRDLETQGKFSKNEKLSFISDDMLIIGCDIGSETHYARAIVLSRKLNDAISGRVFYADFGTPQGNQSL